MTEAASSWKRCNTCKKPIAFASGYFTCNVSTCNRKGTDFAFCSVSCWDAHVPVLRHRDAWAEEQQAPTAAEWAGRQRADAERAVAPPPVESRAGGQRQTTSARREEEKPLNDVLIVVSKLKARAHLSDEYVRQRDRGFRSGGRLRPGGRAGPRGRPEDLMDRDFDVR
jgi:hypothetical protein